MYYGLLINSGVSFLIFLICIITSYKLFMHKKDFLISSVSSSIYWLALGLLYLFVGIRTLSAFFGYIEVDRFFQIGAHAVGGWIAPPIVFLFIYFMTENFKISLIPGISMVVVWLIWIIIDIKAGVGNHILNFWASEWTPNSEVARKLAIYGLYIPSILSALSMNFLLLKVKTPIAKFRIFATSLSIIVIMSVVILDYLGPVGIIGRPLILLASIISLLAYSPPGFIRRMMEK